MSRQDEAARLAFTKQVYQLHDMGYSATEIADKLGRAVSGIYQYLRPYKAAKKLTLVPREHRVEGKHVIIDNEHYTVEAETPTHDEIVKLYNSGQSVENIASFLALTPEEVDRHIVKELEPTPVKIKRQRKMKTRRGGYRKDIVNLHLSGLNKSQIARQLGTTWGTVQLHVNRYIEKEAGKTGKAKAIKELLRTPITPTARMFSTPAPVAYKKKGGYTVNRPPYKELYEEANKRVEELEARGFWARLFNRK